MRRDSAQTQWEAMVATHDPSNLMALCAQQPHHVDTLLSLAEVNLAMGRSDDAARLVKQALCVRRRLGRDRAPPPLGLAITLCTYTAHLALCAPAATCSNPRGPRHSGTRCARVGAASTSTPTPPGRCAQRCASGRRCSHGEDVRMLALAGGRGGHDVPPFAPLETDSSHASRPSLPPHSYYLASRSAAG